MVMVLERAEPLGGHDDAERVDRRGANWSCGFGDGRGTSSLGDALLSTCAPRMNF